MLVSFSSHLPVLVQECGKYIQLRGQSGISKNEGPNIHIQECM